MHTQFSPLKVFRYCPKCGNQGLYPDTEKSLKCNFCGLKYFINMNASVVAIIRDEKNEVLYTVRKHDPSAGMLDLPGGFIDLGETAEEAVRREIFEELNLEIENIEFLSTYTNSYIYEEIEYQTLDLVFNCSVSSFDKIQVADDVSGYVFMDPSLVKPEEIGLKSIRQITARIVSKP